MDTVIALGKRRSCLLVSQKDQQGAIGTGFYGRVCEFYVQGACDCGRMAADDDCGRVGDGVALAAPPV